MAVVIQITWRRDLARDRLFGLYVVDYDPTIDSEGNYGITVCDDRAGARRFPTAEKAREYIEGPSPNARDRATGKQGWRPLPQQYYYEVKET